jgi:retinol dehydrogenase-12
VSAEGDRWFAGKGCLITGANTGIGRATAVEMARRGAHVFVACRSEEKGREATAGIIRESGSEHVEFLKLDLASLDSVRKAARGILDRDIALPLLINNAGVAGQRGETADGFELHFGTNHLGHFLLTALLLDRLKESRPARIVNVSSKAHYEARGIDFDALRGKTRSFAGLREYSVSKLANVLFSAELARRLGKDAGVTTYSLHPGVVASDAWRRIPWPIRSFVTRNMISNEEGAKTTLHCATSPQAEKETGLYYDECKTKEPNPIGKDLDLAARLWRESERWAGV